MNGNARPALRHIEEPRWELSSAVRLESAAAFVFGVEWAEEDEARDVVRTGQELRTAADPAPALADIGFFLVSWGAERIAGLRIRCGDLGIDETQHRIEDFGRGSREWHEAVAEYQSLADEILIDTLNEFREFDFVVLYSGHREDYVRRRAAGMAQLAQLYPAFATQSQPTPFLFAPNTGSPAPLALAG